MRFLSVLLIDVLLLASCAVGDYPQEDAPWKDDVRCGPGCADEPTPQTCRLEAYCASWTPACQDGDDVCASAKLDRRQIDLVPACVDDAGAAKLEAGWIADCRALMATTCESSWACAAGCLPDAESDICDAQYSE